MKPNIHPQYYTDTIVSCACGNTFTTGSTQKKIIVEVCYKCHPLYTGEHRFLDVKGRVEKFQKQQQVAQAYKQNKSNKKSKKDGKTGLEPKSLKELLGEI